MKNLLNGPFGRLVLRPVLYGLPFALFFSYLQGRGMATLGPYYIASIYFAFVITLFVEANRAWVVPRLRVDRRGPPSRRVMASFALAGLLGSIAAGALLHFTIAPGTFGSERAIVLLLLFSVIFIVLVMGMIYARRMQGLLVQRIRDEAEREVRKEQEMRVAAAIQQALLPPRIRSGASYSAAGASIPCRTIGGNFFEYFDLPDGRLGFALGDVAGKGPPAAILAAMVQGIFTTNVSADGAQSPAATLTRVNRALCRRPIETRFATMAYMILAPDGTLVSCSAGHNHAFVIGADGSERRLGCGGLLVGAFETATYEEESLKLSPGDTIVLWSDGVSDAESPAGEQFGEDRFRSLLFDGGKPQEPPLLLDRVLQSVQAFAADRPLADDVTVLIVRFEATGR